MSEEFERLLRSAFPESADLAVIRAVADGVILADDLRRNTPWLGSLVGDDLSGMLRRAAVMWRIHAFCKSGDLPFKAEEIENSTGSSHLLSVRSGRFEAHVVRTDSPGAFPKDTPIRQDCRLSNIGDLFDNPKTIPIADMIDAVQPYAWIAFNATPIGALTHVCLGMPHGKENVWLTRLNILRCAMTATPVSPAPVPPRPDPTESMKFRKHIADQIERDKTKRKDEGA